MMIMVRVLINLVVVEVVPVESGGKIEIPAFVEEFGNTFITAQIIPAVSTKPSSTVTQHVEVVNVKLDVPTKIARVSKVINPGSPITIQGQNLNALQKAALVSQDGSQTDLGRDYFGSSLEQIRIAPKGVKKGTYSFVAWDDKGKKYEAPNKIKRPSLKLDGTKISHVGEEGKITIVSDTDGKLIVSGGEPQITLHEGLIDMSANKPRSVDFTAKQLGEYTVNVILLNPEDITAPPDAPPVDAEAGPIQTNYDPSSDQTEVTAPVSVISEGGKSMSNVTVDIAVTHPGGIEYDRVTTDREGRATFFQSFAGNIAASALSAHVYRVLEYPWKRKGPCDCSFDVKKEEDTPSIKLAPFVKDNWQNLRDRIEEKAKKLKEEKKEAEAKELLEKKPPKTPAEYEKEIERAMKSGEDFQFTILKGGAAMSIADGSAVFGDAAAFAMQSKIGNIKLRDLFTAEKDEKTPLKTKKVKGKVVHKLLCSRKDCEFIGAAATFIGLKGLSEIHNLSEVGGSDEEFKALKDIVRKIPIPKEFPVFGQIKEAALKFVNLKADVLTRVKSSIKVKSDEFGGLDDEISLKASARLTKTEDAEVFDKHTSVGKKDDDKGRTIYDTDVEFARGTSGTHPSTITFNADVESLSKALGIGAAHSQINSAWGVAYIFTCMCKEGGGNACNNFEYNVVANVELGEEIDAAMKRIKKAVEDWNPPTTMKQAEKISKKLEKLMKKEIEPIFK